MLYSERWTLVVLIAISALVIGGLALIAWRRRQSPLGQAFFLLCLSMTFYTFGYTCELASNTLEAIRFWLRVESIGIAFLPTVWIMLAVNHTGTKGKSWPQMQAFMFMLSAITFIISNTSEFHHLHYGPMRLNPEAPFPVVDFVPGFWYWVHAVFINLAILFGNILYARAWLHAPYDKRQQAFVLFLGSLFPWIVFIAYLLRLIPWGIDPSPIAFLVPGLLYAWAAFGLKMLEIAPIARLAVFQRLSDGVFVFDRERRLADFNIAGNRAFPELNAAAKGKDGIELFREYPAMLSAIDDPADEPRTMWLEACGEKVNYRLQRIELYDREEHMVGFMLIIQDITHFSVAMEGLRLQAATDPLTKVWNRNRWQEDGDTLLAHAHRTREPISLILVDIDKFKPINDNYGHQIGDAVLRDFAMTCRKNLRAQDILGRYGGDEFFILLPNVNTTEAAQLAERLKLAVESMPVVAGEHKIGITASFGVVTEQAGGPVNLEEMVRQADEALYAAKKAGGNHVCFR